MTFPSTVRGRSSDLKKAPVPFIRAQSANPETWPNALTGALEFLLVLRYPHRLGHARPAYFRLVLQSLALAPDISDQVPSAGCVIQLAPDFRDGGDEDPVAGRLFDRIQRRQKLVWRNMIYGRVKQQGQYCGFLLARGEGDTADRQDRRRNEGDLQRFGNSFAAALSSRSVTRSSCFAVRSDASSSVPSRGKIVRASPKSARRM